MENNTISNGNELCNKNIGITKTSDLDDIAVMSIVPNVERDSVAGSYSGTLYFDISLKTD